MAARNALIRELHVAKRELGLDEDTYRGALQAAVGKRSAKDMDEAELDRALAHFRARGFGQGARRPSASRLSAIDGPARVHVKKAQALWISAYNLGLVADRSDKALEAFIVRQTKLAKAEWLTSAGDARKVIEALKSWLARDGGVDWSQADEKAHAIFQAWHGWHIYWVVSAQWRMLVKLKAAEGPDVLAYGRVLLKAAPQHWERRDFIRLSNDLGEKIRAFKRSAT